MGTGRGPGSGLDRELAASRWEVGCEGDAGARAEEERLQKMQVALMAEKRRMLASELEMLDTLTASLTEALHGDAAVKIDHLLADIVRTEAVRAAAQALQAVVAPLQAELGRNDARVALRRLHLVVRGQGEPGGGPLGDGFSACLAGRAD